MYLLHRVGLAGVDIQMDTHVGIDLLYLLNFTFCSYSNCHPASSNDLVNEEDHLALAHQSYKSGKYSQALEHGNAVYEKNPRRTDNLLLLGAIYFQVITIVMLGHVLSYFIPNPSLKVWFPLAS